MEFEVLIENNNELFIPPIEGRISLKTERSGTPGQLEFNILTNNDISISEGDAVRFKYKGVDMFFGFIFKLKSDKEHIISVTCYDQLRYLKNKDTYVYNNKTATELIKMIADDFNLKCGDMDDTKYKIASRIEDNMTLVDIINNALDLTLKHRGEMYIIYDDFGKIRLSNIASMIVEILIDAETGENYDYTSSIDSNTYNCIKLTYDNEESGVRDVYVTKDTNNINKWGVLQYTDTISKGENGKAKADALLSFYNQKSRSLSINGVFGDVRVRGGSMILVRLKLFDMQLDNLMIVDKCTHIFENNEHIMDLTLRGGEINT